MRLGVACWATFLFAATGSAQVARVSGVVVDERQVPVAGATVRLTGDISQSTGASGRFEFVGVAHGRYLVAVTAIGHQLRSVELPLTKDTMLTVVLTRRSVTLDTMIVRPGTIRIRGIAVDSASGDYLLHAQATLYPGGRFVGALNGRFTFDSVAPGPVTIIVEGAEHLPARVAFDAGRDTTLHVRLGVDSIALRMIAIQVQRLQDRSQALPMPTTTLNRDAIGREKTMSVNELLIRRLYEDPVAVRKAAVNSPDSGCFFLDDVKVSRGRYDGLLPEMVERVEIFRSAGTGVPSMRGPSGTRNFGGVRMVRVYTRRYVATLPARPSLPRIVYLNTGSRGTCA